MYLEKWAYFFFVFDLDARFNVCDIFTLKYFDTLHSTLLELEDWFMSKSFLQTSTLRAFKV